MVKINSLELENVKRIKAVKIEPTENGLTVIGGRNNQGKTSVLDSIAWALGGDRFRPSQPARDGSTIPPHLHIVLSNGLVVDRAGKNSDLKVTDPNGNKAGQQLLNEFVEQLALNLPKFIESSNKDKANTLLQIIGVGDQLHELERQETELYNQRHAIGQIADRKAKFAKEMTYWPDAPKDLVSASELISQQQEILARNGENQRKRNRAAQIKSEWDRQGQVVSTLKLQLDEAIKKLEQLARDLEVANMDTLDLHDESTAELEDNIRKIEAINAKVRDNLNKDKAEEDAKNFRDQYDTLTTQIESVRMKKMELLNNADLPLEGLSVEDGELTYQGKKWDNMSGSDQLRVSTAIVRKLNPNCGFVLLDKLEQMDLDTMWEFSAWLEQEGLQAIATRVSTGGECSIIIEDGYVAGADTHAAEAKTWKAGEF